MGKILGITEKTENEIEEVLHVPATDLMEAYTEATKDVAKPSTSTLNSGSVKYQVLDKSVPGYPADDFPPAMTVEEPPRPKTFLYESMIHCVICGAKLEVFVLDTKECPKGHGQAWVTESKGKSVITFEPSNSDS